MQIVTTTREGAHHAALAAYEEAKRLIADGKRVVISAAEDEDDRSLQQNRYMWGVVMKETSEQAQIGGQRYTAEAFHELGKRLFLGFEIVKVDVAGRRKKTVIRRLRSTRDLSVKKMSAYLEQFIAWAVTDYGVTFSEKDWKEYRA